MKLLQLKMIMGLFNIALLAVATYFMYSAYTYEKEIQSLQKDTDEYQEIDGTGLKSFEIIADSLIHLEHDRLELFLRPFHNVENDQGVLIRAYLGNQAISNQELRAFNGDIKNLKIDVINRDTGEKYSLKKR